MGRCIELAKLAAGNAAPNPLVGAILVYENRIIGEGYHEQYGHVHAEVNCINAVSVGDTQFIQKSILYVSLEPCSHFGKTPPCADLIIKNKIPKVIIGCRDSFEKVDGSGIEKLQAAGVEVVVGIMEAECLALNKRFFIFHKEKRPYIILKWAQTSNGKIAAENAASLKISNDFTNRLVHKWRGEEAAILIGTNTALQDNPLLTTRLWAGKNPVRILLDYDLKIPLHNEIFNDHSKTIIINKKENKIIGSNHFFKTDVDLKSLMSILYNENLTSIIIEGGAKTLQLFIDTGYWDETRIIKNKTMEVPLGIDGPQLTQGLLFKTEKIFSDDIYYYTNLKQKRID